MHTSVGNDFVLKKPQSVKFSGSIAEVVLEEQQAFEEEKEAAKEP